MNLPLIASKDNSNIKDLKKLSQRKYRDKLGLFKVENLKIINDAINSGFDLEKIYIEGSLMEDEKLINILNKTKSTEKYFIDNKLNKHISDLETPTGVCAVFKKIESRDYKSDKLLYLNKISDPGNLGTIFRTALAFGYKDVIIDEGSVDIYNAKTISAAKDAIFKVNVIKDSELSLLNKIVETHIIVSTVMQKGKNLNDFENKNKICFVFGNESQGVDFEIIEMSNDFLSIKMNNEMESLNVSSVVAIILHHFS